MPISKFPVQQALDFIDGTLINELLFSRIDKATRSKTHFFEAGTGGKQFAVVVGDVDNKSGKYKPKQTRIFLEEPPDEILDVQNLPIDKPWRGGSAERGFSRLKPPKQHSVLVSSEAGLRSLLKWYTSTNGVADIASPNVHSAHPPSIPSPEITTPTLELDKDGPNYQLDPKKRNCIEEYAVKWAKKHYEAQGFSVEERGKPFDLLCKKLDLIVHVEVKGTIGSGKTVTLTRNEVIDARKPEWRSDLFIVHNIRLDPIEETWCASEGTELIFETWQPDDEDLSPVEYEYRVPSKP
ncbi:MAG TPA: DUF3883 domain-containing protein [Chryseolinea sp.]|nr:DUF3883 domain-containing protein [Chryseolinea sp.]